jgi:hypothetical protein
MKKMRLLQKKSNSSISNILEEVNKKQEQFPKDFIKTQVINKYKKKLQVKNIHLKEELSE